VNEVFIYFWQAHIRGLTFGADRCKKNLQALRGLQVFHKQQLLL
jgi:hypothetical protein